MPSSSNALVTIDCKNPPGWLTPIPLSRDNVTRDKTVFHVISDNNVVSFMGTYDEIIDYTAKLMSVMYSWPLIAGRSDWFDDLIPMGQEKASSNVSRSSEPGTEGSDRGSGETQSAVGQ